MNRVLLGVLAGLLLVAAAIFWWEGRAETEVGRAPEVTLAGGGTAAAPLPSADPSGVRGVEPPEALEVTREQRRFDRLDRNRDGKISREEMLAARADAFRKLDVNHDNLLTFDEWAVRTSDRFKNADVNHDGWLSRAEFATTRAKHGARPQCRCAQPAGGRRGAAPAPEASDDSGEDGAEPGE